MSNELRRKRLETECIVVGYAMSRLDDSYLFLLGCQTWKDAFQKAAAALKAKPASFKNLRDEFDPFHGNPRKGWHNRPLRPNRQRVLADLCEVSDEALAELVARILRRDKKATAEAIDSLAASPRVAHNVAERLLTGRLAEDHFLNNSGSIIGVQPDDLIDLRTAARGYDFGVKHRPDFAIEVKGLKGSRGQILFTDREWREAGARRSEYRVVVIGNLAKRPTARVIADPLANIHPNCRYQASLIAIWTAIVTVP